jgi:hypothetical protein
MTARQAKIEALKILDKALEPFMGENGNVESALDDLRIEFQCRAAKLKATEDRALSKKKPKGYR